MYYYKYYNVSCAFVFLKLFFTVTIPFIFLNLLLMDVCISILLRATMDRFKLHAPTIYITSSLVLCLVAFRDEYLWSSFRVSGDSKSRLRRLKLIDSRFHEDLLIQVNNLQVFDKKIYIYSIQSSLVAIREGVKLFSGDKNTPYEMLAN